MELPLLPLPKGRFIIAVSGGVDSVVLLHVLAADNPGLIVAHVDHGMRPTAKRDADFTRGLAEKFNLPFELLEASLGEGASEAQARKVRYDFLHKVCKKHNARGIITAHHQDDVLETIIINITRGTGWRGLSSLRSHVDLLRPLINASKAQIYDYAMSHNLQWNEDETNQNIHILRNNIRHTVLPYICASLRGKLIELWKQQSKLCGEIESETAKVLQLWIEVDKNSVQINRYHFIMVSDDVAIELLQNVVQKLTNQRLLRLQAANLLLFIKTAGPGQAYSPNKSLKFTAFMRQIIVGNP